MCRRLPQLLLRRILPSREQPGSRAPQESRLRFREARTILLFPPRSRQRRRRQANPWSPGAYVEQGVASWYGVPFHGRRAADGEVYDMNKFTAAHRTLPFDSVVRVTNLSNGLQTEVRIIDRGPFVGDRVIDLSAAAARALAMIGPGTAMVRIEMVSGSISLAGSFTVQVGAFSDRRTQRD